ncbi:MAG: hypothetical protein IJ154_00315 [Bacteroidales bacterium]|nr:hypothetical protein [Bacteroidales bacterium]
MVPFISRADLSAVAGLHPKALQKYKKCFIFVLFHMRNIHSTPMKKLHLSCFLTLVFCLLSTLRAQQRDTVRFWNLASYSQTTLANLAADADHWTMNSKGGRYQNVVATDGLELYANGRIIPETQGIFVGAGVPAGSLLLCYDRGSSGNGLQNQGSVPTTLKGLKAGQKIEITLRSSSSGANGISDVGNLEGEFGVSSYTPASFKSYTLSVVSDGDVWFKNSGGIIIRSILVYEEAEDIRPQAVMPVIHTEKKTARIAGIDKDILRVSLSTETPGATILYSLVDHGRVEDYARVYEGPFDLDRSCRFRAVALKDGMRTSDEAEMQIKVPLILPAAGRPWVLDPEPLNRGAIAVKAASTNYYLISWRWLADDPADISFNVYRDQTKINSSPITDKTNISDAAGTGDQVYTIEALSGGQVIERSTALMLDKGYLEIPLRRPSDSTTQSGNYYYVPGDCMVADLDGDREYDIVMKWDPVNEDGINDNVGAGQKDNSIGGYTGPVIIDAYKMDGSFLWRINLGKNIRAGAHYTQLMVYDLDGDGKAEVACKTAPGTVDGQGRHVLLGEDDPTADYRASYGGKDGIIIKGPEYLTVFDGQTGAARATVPYRPSRDTISDWGDSYGNRCERYLAGVAYLDGQHPSLVMCRGYYTAAFLWAVDFDGKDLKTRWLHSSTRAGYGAYGEGAHSLCIADVDGDGCDEIIYGSCTVDNDGSLLYRTGFGHGDALHVGDFGPDRPGLEVMMVHEEKTAQYGIEMREALSGKVISGVFAGSDVGRGLCADIDGNHRGCEYWGYGNNVYNVKGEVITTKRPSTNFRTYWDADLLEECTERGVITKYQSSSDSHRTLVDFVSTYKAGTNMIKATPCLQADIFGDWREEQIYYDSSTKSKLMIFSTNLPTNYRVPTLMHDHHYRMSTVTQTAAYNQPPHLSYYLPDYIQYLTDNPKIPVDGQLGQALERHWFDLYGRRLSEEPRQGIFIEEQVYPDGRRLRFKRLAR